MAAILNLEETFYTVATGYIVIHSVAGLMKEFLRSYRRKVAREEDNFQQDILISNLRDEIAALKTKSDATRIDKNTPAESK